LQYYWDQNHVKNIYITGASGVIGSELAAAFTDDGGAAGVRAVSRRPCPTIAADHLAQFQTSAIFDGSWFATDDTDATILHCAGLSDPRATFRNFGVLAHEHILPHVEMVEALLANGWRGRLVFFSSGGTVYGEALYLPIREDHPKDPISMYGLHKLILERALAQMAEDRGFELVILRVSNPYGSMVTKPNQGVIPILITAMLRDTEFQIIGDGHAERDYLEITDLIAAVRKVIASEMRKPVEIFNIGSGERTSILDLIAVLTRLTGHELRTVYSASKDDVKSNVLDCSRAQEMLGCEAKVSLEDGLAKLVERMNVHHHAA
jgi:UDP-glucose 4-epimerase